MNKNILILLFGFPLYLTSLPVFSTVLGSGDLTLNLIGNGQVSGQYIYSDRQYGRIRDYDGTGTNVVTYLDQTTLQNQTSFRGTTLRGSFDPGTAAADFAFDVNVATPGGNNYSSASVDLYGRALYTGILNDFSYTYDFSASKDDATDRVQFIIQMEISYWDQNTNAYLKVYSDYGTSNFSPNLNPDDLFRTNWVSNSDNTNMTVALNGANRFGDYSTYGSRNWVIRYDLQSFGMDSVGATTTQSVPEPYSIALISIGLAALRFRRRKTIL